MRHKYISNPKAKESNFNIYYMALCFLIFNQEQLHMKMGQLFFLLFLLYIYIYMCEKNIWGFPLPFSVGFKLKLGFLLTWCYVGVYMCIYILFYAYYLERNGCEKLSKNRGPFIKNNTSERLRLISVVFVSFYKRSLLAS